MIKRSTVLEAAGLLKLEQGAKALRALLKGGKHELRLYALTDKDTMECEIEVDSGIAAKVMDDILLNLQSRLHDLGVART